MFEDSEEVLTWIHLFYFRNLCWSNCFPFLIIHPFIRRIMGALVNGDPAVRLLYDIDPSQPDDDYWRDTLMSVVCHFLDGSPVDLHAASIAMALSISPNGQTGKCDC